MIIQLLFKYNYFIHIDAGLRRWLQIPLQKALHILSLMHNSCFQALALHRLYLYTARDTKPPFSFSENSGERISFNTLSFKQGSN